MARNGLGDRRHFSHAAASGEPPHTAGNGRRGRDGAVSNGIDGDDLFGRDAAQAPSGSRGERVDAGGRGRRGLAALGAFADEPGPVEADAEDLRAMQSELEAALEYIIACEGERGVVRILATVADTLRRRRD